MKLFMHAGACSLSPHIVSRELGLSLELIEVDRKTQKTAAGDDFLEINGNGYVPVLVLDTGETFTEGPAIVQYLANLRPEAGLLPGPGTNEHTQVQSWLNFITSEIHKPMGMLFQPAYADARSALHGLVSKRLDWLSTRLISPFLIGQQFTVADAYLFVCLNWSPWINIDLSQRPILQEFMKRVAARTKVQEALNAEGLFKQEVGGIFYAPRLRENSTSAQEVRP